MILKDNDNNNDRRVIQHNNIDITLCLVSENKFYELYTPDEKAKLYSAIGYEENEVDLNLPVEVRHTVLNK